MAKRVLIAQAAVLGGLLLALFVRELPGLAREVKILRMAGSRSGYPPAG